MRRIFKYELMVTDFQTVNSYNYFKPLSIIVQDGRPMLYAMIDDETGSRQWPIRTYGTGQNVDDNECDEQFVGTYTLMEGIVVYHVFWRY